MKPRVSVIMPAYNSAAHLREAVDSILLQTWSDFELIIINDGSTDDTEAIVQSYTDPRIRYLRNPGNLQIVRTLNRGLDLAQGEFIARMDADDISLPERLEQQLNYLNRHPRVAVCGSWVQLFGHSEATYREQIYPADGEAIKVKMLFHCALAHPAIMARRSFFANLRYDPAFNKAEDYALWTSASGDFRFANLQQVLLRYRTHPAQTAHRHGNLQQERTELALRQYLGRATGLEEPEWKGFLDFRGGYARDLRIQMRALNRIERENQTHRFFEPNLLHQEFNSRLRQHLRSPRYSARALTTPLGLIQALGRLRR
jgi:glycosyltransferase involved in cell wall biosynthesis